MIDFLYIRFNALMRTFSCFSLLILHCLYPLLGASSSPFCNVMSCYALLCYVMLCYVVLCYVMLYYVMLCYIMLCCVVLCYVILCYIMSYRVAHHAGKNIKNKIKRKG